MSTKVNISRFQWRFWLEWKLSPSSTAYNTPLIYMIGGRLNIDELINALSDFINYDDEGCRSYFLEDKQGLSKESVQQIILDKVKIDLVYQKLDSSDSEKKNEVIDEFITNITEHQFSLTTWPLFKFGLLALSPTEHILVLNFHHIISDAITAEYFVARVAERYNANCKDSRVSAALDTVPTLREYNDYEVKNYSDTKLVEDQKYWEQFLDDADLYLNFPVRKCVISHVGKSRAINFKLKQDKFIKLKKCLKQQKTSLFIFLAGLYGLLLLRYANQKTVVINYPLNMRPAGFRKKTGCFVNNALFKVTRNLAKPFVTVLETLTKQRKTSKKHQGCALIDIVQRLRNSGRLQDNRFFNVDIYEAFLSLKPLALSGLEVKPIPYEHAVSTTDISLAYQQLDDGLAFRLDYNAEKYDEDIIYSFYQNFKALLEQATTNPAIDISRIALSGFDKYLKNSSSNILPLKTMSTICERIADAAIHYAQYTAIKLGDKHITYSDLNAKANQLAWYLKDHGVGPGCYVGIHLNRSIEMIIAIIAVLKAQAAYVPLDPDYPESRLNIIVDDAKLTLLISDTNLNNKCKLSAENQILIDRIWDSISNNSQENLPAIRSDLQTAYVMYTSGSTGKPKGVMVNHRGLINHGLFVKDKFKLNCSDIVLQFSSMSFDISVEEIFPTLISGASLVLYPEVNKLSTAKFNDFVKCEKISVLNLPTAFWHAWVSTLKTTDASMLRSVRLLIVGGEQPNSVILAKWFGLAPINSNWINSYGPTETTVVVATYELSHKDFSRLPDSYCIPMGLPITNVQLHVLDDYYNPVPDGVIGDLFVGGLGLATGYVNEPLITALSFIPDRFSNLPGARLYHTGDKVRRLALGDLEYVGRADQQVKIRGFRVDLSEVEFTLLQYKTVKNIIVTSANLSDTGSSLIAYLEIVPSESFNESSLKQFAQSKLPSYMCPSYYVVLEKIPLTDNGKVNRENLPMPINKDLPSNNIVIQPSNKIEQKLSGIWKLVLGVDAVGINNNFFEVGGHSLNLLVLHAEIEKLFSIHLPMVELFKYPTIKSFAAYLADASSDDIAKISEDVDKNVKKQRAALKRNRRKRTGEKLSYD